MKKYLFTVIVCFLVLSARSQSWFTEGNGGTDTKVNFIGTKDNRSLLFRINNTFSGLLDSNWQQTFFGFRAGRDISSGSNNVALGYLAMSSNTSGHHSTAAGSRALMNNNTGTENCAFGYASLNNNTTGNNNAATGNISLYSNTTGYGNAAHGFGALSQSNGNYNTAQGYEALYITHPWAVVRFFTAMVPAIILVWGTMPAILL
jgi:trimeric autotransporter adhesin